MHYLKQTQLGLTLIELLISLGLGVFLISVSLQIYFSSQHTYSVLEGGSLLQNNARFGLSFIGKSVNYSGYQVSLGKGAMEDAFPTDAIFGKAQAIAASDGAGANRDVLRLRYRGNDDGLVRDCLGNPISGSELVTVMYSVNSAGDLICTGKGGAESVVVSGVDDFQVQFGVDSDDTDKVTKYVAPALMQAGDWKKILAVKVGLLVNSEKPVSGVKAAKSYNVLASQTRSYDDRLMRREFIETFNIRNRAP